LAFENRLAELAGKNSWKEFVSTFHGNESSSNFILTKKYFTFLIMSWPLRTKHNLTPSFGFFVITKQRCFKDKIAS